MGLEGSQDETRWELVHGPPLRMPGIFQERISWVWLEHKVCGGEHEIWRHFDGLQGAFDCLEAEAMWSKSLCAAETARKWPLPEREGTNQEAAVAVSAWDQSQGSVGAAEGV